MLHFSAPGDDSWGHLVFTVDHPEIDKLRSSLLKLTEIERQQSDTHGDTAKEEKKYRRPMNRASADCARLFKKAKRIDPGTRMRHVVDEYIEKHGGSVLSIIRILNDNPDQWKGDKKTTERDK